MVASRCGGGGRLLLLGRLLFIVVFGCCEFAAAAGGSGENDNAEHVCERHGFTFSQCDALGCCEWDDGECWSRVGTCPCDSKVDDDEMEACDYEGDHMGEMDCEIVPAMFVSVFAFAGIAVISCAVFGAAISKQEMEEFRSYGQTIDGRCVFKHISTTHSSEGGTSTHFHFSYEYCIQDMQDEVWRKVKKETRVSSSQYNSIQEGAMIKVVHLQSVTGTPKTAIPEFKLQADGNMGECQCIATSLFGAVFSMFGILPLIAMCGPVSIVFLLLIGAGAAGVRSCLLERAKKERTYLPTTGSATCIVQLNYHTITCHS